MSFKLYPDFPERKMVELDGCWEFSFLGNQQSIAEVDLRKIVYRDFLPVPSAFDAYPAYAGLRGIAACRTSFELSPGTTGELEFFAAGPFCTVFVDGQKLGSHHPGFTRFTMLVPPASHAQRELTVLVDNRFDRCQSPLVDRAFDFYNYGGITRSVRLWQLPSQAVQWCRITPLDCAGTLEIELQMYEKSDAELTIELSFDQKPPEAMLVKLKAGRGKITLKLSHPKLWSPASPHLHIASLRTAHDRLEVRFGVRKVEAKDGKILLNGEPVKLLGVCRHEAHPQFGPALPFQQIVQDLQLLRDLGCNFVRGSHYPQDPRFLELCDEMGILVFEENLGWGQNQDYLTDPEFIRLQLESTREMIDASYNHPCVIIRGFLNEADSSVEAARPCYQALVDLIRREDPGRCVAYASNRYQLDRFLTMVDIVCFNLYPGWYGSMENDDPLSEILPRIQAELAWLAAQPELKGKPFVISEIGAGAVYGWHDALNGFWTEEYQSDFLRIACNEVISNPAIAGVALWQFCDCRTYQGCRALGRPRAFNNKGLLDEYRRPKLAYNTVKTIFGGYKHK
ncbi:MAG: glycoside hydrolase family 2 TIM barrel-domain containing protein [Lentisphaerota bacterium]